jgi:ArsR family transcriptional regulator, arsenate/arsenite/antimonite-responsive transcriptional repressor
MVDQESAVAVFESLSSGVRLDVFRLLVKAEPHGIVAGEIAAALDIAPSSLSFHLRTLTQAGLLSVGQEGRFLRYRANLALMGEVVSFLTENCCNGAPGRCADMDALTAQIPCCSPQSPPDRDLG